MATESIDEAEERGFTVVRTIPLEKTSFTQGLEILNGSIYQSSGLYGESRISEIDTCKAGILSEKWKSMIHTSQKELRFMTNQ